MKLTLLVLVGTFLMFLSSTAQDTLPHFSYNLVALRNRERAFFNIGTRLVIKYKGSSSTQRARGAFAGAMNGRIAIGGKGGNEKMTFIPIEDISMVRKVHPKRRVAFGIIGTVLVGGGAAILENGANSPGSAMRGALAIPVIGIGSYFLFAVPITLMTRSLMRKSEKMVGSLNYRSSKSKS